MTHRGERWRTLADESASGNTPLTSANVVNGDGHRAADLKSSPPVGRAGWGSQQGWTSRTLNWPQGRLLSEGPSGTPMELHTSPPFWFPWPAIAIEPPVS